LPVLVHAAHRPLARRLVHRLLAQGGQVRALAARDVASLRAAGAFVATADPDDEGTLEAALTGAHTLVVLLGGLGASDAARVVEEGLVAARAAQGAQIERLILVTMAGADGAAQDELRRAHATVAAAVAELPLPSVELRVGLVDTSATRDLLVAAGLPSELRSTMIAPVRIDDLLELITAVDDARSSSRDGHLVLAADGPRHASIDAFLEALARIGGHGGQGLTGRRVPSSAQREALCATLDGPWWNEDAAVPDAWDLLGVTATSPLDEVQP
jgi:uncharacterized protein YbjT (DUF2867 family)